METHPLNYLHLLAHYSSAAYERVYTTCAALPDAEYRKLRPVSFQSVHGLLNHLLLADRIWLGRFESQEPTSTPPLNTVLYDELPALWEAQQAESARLSRFVEGLTAAGSTRELYYRNSASQEQRDPLGMCLLHLFNHQTHHRGQIHTLLSAADVQPPSLDLHRIIRPTLTSA